MTVTHREDLPGRRVKLTIAIDTETWHKALADAYRENHAFFPVEGHAPGTAPREALEAAYAPDVLYQEAVNLPSPWPRSARTATALMPWWICIRR